LIDLATYSCLTRGQVLKTHKHEVEADVNHRSKPLLSVFEALLPPFYPCLSAV